MTRFSFIAYLVILSVAHGNQEQVDTCGTQDEACLVQTSVTHHKRRKVKSVTKTHQVLADLEKEASKTPGGPAMLQDILHGVMHLPPLKSKESLFGSNRFRAALRAQLHLQHLAKRNPTLLAMIEDPHHVEQIQAALFQGDPSLSKIFAQQRRMPSDHKASLFAFSQRRSSEHPGPLLVWTQGWGCETEVSCMQFPYGKSPLFTAPLFGPNCSGWPWISKLAASYEEEGAVMLVDQWSDTEMKYIFVVKWLGHDGIVELGSLPTSPGQWISSSVFSLEAGKLFYILQGGDWPDYTFTLMGASEEGIETLVNITDCLYPYHLKASGGDMVWACSMDWEKENDKYKLMKYSVGGGPPKVLYESEDWFGNVYMTPSAVYYSMWDGASSIVWKCSLSEEPCNPEFFASLPDGAWNYIIQSGRLVTTTWISIKEDRPSGDTKYYTDYDVIFGHGDPVARIPGHDHLQIIMPPVYISHEYEQGSDGYGSGSGSGTLHFPEASGEYGSGYGSGDFDIQKSMMQKSTGAKSMLSKSIAGLAKVLKNGRLART